MFGTYHKEDVTILLKDITGLVTPLSTQERERRIQSGVHYSEMLPIEYEPTERYYQIYAAALQRYAATTAKAVGNAAVQIWEQKGKDAVLVSLARAGTPIGILLRRYLKARYHADIPHYTISIIKGKGIDKNALRYILERHAPRNIQFVDGWTGKGAIRDVLEEALHEFPEVRPDLAVLSDPACVAGICGTHEDFLIPSSCLNATVSGLLSRTFLRSDIIGENDFHGAVFYREWMQRDKTYEFIDTITAHFALEEAAGQISPVPEGAGYREAEQIRQAFGIRNIGYVKPGIGETTRVLLRRLPWKILVHSLTDEENLGHIYQLAKEKDVAVIAYPLQHYRACGLIQELAEV